MGTGEGGTPTKTPKTSSALQEPAPSYPEWAAAFQAYYGPGATPPPPGYFPSTVGSGPQPHPYMWGGQPMISPYGTPPPHATLYTYGGIYAHPPSAHPYGQYGLASPSTEMTVAALPASAEAEARASEGKERNAAKKLRGNLGSLGMLTGKGSESVKGTSASANGHTPSAESASDGSTEGSDDSAQNGSQHKGTYERGGVDVMEAYMNPAVGNPVNPGPTVSVTGKPVAAGPTTNLNIGMDYWSGSSAAAPAGAFPSPPASAKPPSKRNSSALISAPPNTHHLMGSTTTDLWLHDERELKRQRRKQSNRESARRSRLRKQLFRAQFRRPHEQAECEELTTRVDTLTVENVALRTELNRLAEECKKLSEENATLLERLREVQGRECHEEKRSAVQVGKLDQTEIETMLERQSTDGGDDPCSPNNRSLEVIYRKNETPSSRPESNTPHSDAVAAA